MSWVSAIIGAGIGMALGGPIGAGIGALIGGSVNAQIAGGGRSRPRPSVAQKNQAVFFACLFSMLAKMAKADGVVHRSEIDETAKFMREINLDDDDRRTAVKIFNNAKSDHYTIYDYAAQYAGLADLSMRILLYEVLWKVALADGSVHAKEEEILRNIPNHLKIGGDYFDRVYAAVGGAPAPRLDEQYALLNCSPQDSDAAVKQAYRRAIAEYHPDRIQSKGLPDKFLKFANDRSQQINEAYRLIMEARGR